MKRFIILAFSILLTAGVNAQDKKPNLDIKTQIDSVYAFGFDLTESRSAKGGIWNTKTGRPETPLNYTKARKDTVDSVPVVLLYRQVVPGNHPLNGWETWRKNEDGWKTFREGFYKIPGSHTFIIRKKEYHTGLFFQGLC